MRWSGKLFPGAGDRSEEFEACRRHEARRSAEESDFESLLTHAHRPDHVYCGIPISTDRTLTLTLIEASPPPIEHVHLTASWYS